LAVALGIGVAVASSPGIAWADSTESDSAGATSSASTGTGSTSAGPASRDEKPPKTTTGQPSLEKAPDEPTAGNAGSPAKPTADREVPDPASGADNREGKPNKPHRKARANDPSRTADSVQQSTAKPDADRITAHERTMVGSPVTADHRIAQPAASTRTAAEQTLSVQTPSVQELRPAVQASPSAQPADVVTAVVSSLLSAAGLNSSAVGGGPATPPESPTLWAMLGWVRRELGHVFAPATAGTASAVASTSLIEPASSLMAASVLGTQQQLTAERIATQTQDTLPMQLMKLVLRFGFTSAAQQQFDVVHGPDDGNVTQLDAAVDEYAMGAAFQQQLLDSMNPTVVMQVAPPHTWYGQVVPGSRILYDNPDTIYRFMGVNGASSYVITGRFADLDNLPADTTFSVLTGLTGTTASVLTKDQLKFNPDGTFTITADATPANGRDNHLQLTADTTLIATRNTLSDWMNQQPMSLEITRVGGPPASLFSQLGGFAIPGLAPLVINNPLLTNLVSLVPPLPSTPPLLRGAVAAVIMALGIQREAQYIAVATTDPTTGERIQPNVLKNPTRNAEFLATQLQSAGYFQLADDEALVLTIDPGDAKYFVVPVTNDWTITNDYWNEQTSLNNVQATPIGGVYTIVISPTDPLVKNWVSTGGLNQGTISIRFQDLPLEPTHLPTVQAQVVPLNQLATVLPTGTTYLTTGQRDAQLAARKVGFDNRFTPYPQP
jgi:hypothetical protein